MANLAGKAYAMNVVTPVRTRFGALINRLIFMAARLLPTSLHGLLGLKFIHFARWVMIAPKDWPAFGAEKDRPRYHYMLFCSNFNGTWDQYIDAFSDGIPDGLNLFWYSSYKYLGAIPITPFKHYIRHNQVDTNYYYNATPGAAQADIKQALLVMEKLKELQDKHKLSVPLDFADAFREAHYAVQSSLGSQGIAPPASVDTVRAERLREQVVEERWGHKAA
jgi:hypothetical protein